MSEFLDTAIDKAKEVFDVACKKTEKAVTVSKQRFDIASMESKREKAYAKLGKVCFKEMKDTDNGEMAELIEKIEKMNSDIEAARLQLAQLKNKRICPNCGQTIENISVFCNFCGEKLIIEE